MFCKKTYNAEYYKKHRGLAASPRRKNKDPEYARNWYLNKHFKLTTEKYRDMLIFQEGKCAACGKLLPALEDNGRHPSVDHDHECCPGKTSCGKCVRGIVHQKCNAIMGHCNDDPELLSSIARYLYRLK
jgi:hypothetical protein